jgi:hypothetical protein
MYLLGVVSIRIGITKRGFHLNPVNLSVQSGVRIVIVVAQGRYAVAAIDGRVLGAPFR